MGRKIQLKRRILEKKNGRSNEASIRFVEISSENKIKLRKSKKIFQLERGLIEKIIRTILRTWSIEIK
jgi:hypothetical protein